MDALVKPAPSGATGHALVFLLATRGAWAVGAGVDRGACDGLAAQAE